MNRERNPPRSIARRIPFKDLKLMVCFQSVELTFPYPTEVLFAGTLQNGFFLFCQPVASYGRAPFDSL